MRILYKLFILSAIFILQSCYTRYTNNLLQERKNLPQYDKVDVKKYRLKVNDELVIRVLSTNESITKTRKWREIKQARGFFALWA